MSISDDQFAAFLASDDERVLLAHVHFGYEAGSPLSPEIGTLYFGSQEYRTEAGDDPSEQPYLARIIGSPGFSRSLDVASLGGKATFSVSELQLKNGGGELDFMLDLVVDGYKVEYYLGAPMGTPGWTRADFRLVLVVFIERITAPDEKTISIKQRDRRLLLDKEVKGDAMGGSGPNATKYLPVLFGSIENLDISGLLYDELNGIYSVLSNFYPDPGFSIYNTQVLAVRDDGFPLRRDGVGWAAGSTSVDLGTGIVTHVDHNLQVDDVVWFSGEGGFYTGDPSVSNSVGRLPLFDGYPMSPQDGGVWVSAVPTPDTVEFSLTKGGTVIIPTGNVFNPIHPGLGLIMYRQGWKDTSGINGRIQLSRPPVGRLTCDVYNAGYVSDTFSIPENSHFYLAAGLMVLFGEAVWPDDFEVLGSDSFIAAEVALANKVQMGYRSFAATNRMNLITVLNEILDSAFGWYSQDNLGLLVFGMVDPSGIAAATPARSMAAWECKTGLSCENVAPTVSSANVSYRPNYSPQPDGLDRLLEEPERTKYSAPYEKVQLSDAPTGTAYATNPALYHKTMTPGAPAFASINDLSFSYPSFGVTPVDLSQYANEIVQDRRPNLKVLKTTSGIDKYNWRLGEVISLTYPRFGFDAGRNVRLIGIGVDLLGGKVDLTFLTYVAPEVDTASYN